jgi:uncharacterized membrane protein
LSPRPESTAVTSPWLVRVVTVAAALWTAGALLIPLLEGSGRPTFETAGAVVRLLLYRPLCHQLPERCVLLADRPLAVCARCTGLYLGGAAGLVLMALPLARGWRGPGPLATLLAAAPTLLDAGIGHAGGRGLPNLPRLAVAVPAGLALGALLGRALSELGGFPRRSRPRAAATPPEDPVQRTRQERAFTLRTQETQTDGQGG